MLASSKKAHLCVVAKSLTLDGRLISMRSNKIHLVILHAALSGMHAHVSNLNPACSWQTFCMENENYMEREQQHVNILNGFYYGCNCIQKSWFGT